MVVLFFGTPISVSLAITRSRSGKRGLIKYSMVDEMSSQHGLWKEELKHNANVDLVQIGVMPLCIVVFFVEFITCTLVH